jgi:tetratricopeptide (TPR) repeat protein
LFPELEYSFKHALTHEVTYGGLLQASSRELHARIVQAIEGLYPDRLNEQVNRLAHHALNGEIWEKAIAYSRTAGMRAAGHGAYKEAADCFERALVASARLPQDRRVIEEDVELRFALRNALWPAGEFDRILPHLREAIRGSDALADEPRIARSCSFMSQYFWIVSDYQNAIESGLRAETIGRAHNDLSLQISTNLHLGLAHHALGDYLKSIEVLGRNVELLKEKLVNEHFGLAALPSVYSRTWLAWSFAELGEFREGLQVGRDEVKIAEAAGHPLTQINALFGIGYVHLKQGNIGDAVAALERAVRALRERKSTVLATSRILAPRVCLRSVGPRH